jgi:hypothetical protein
VNPLVCAAVVGTGVIVSEIGIVISDEIKGRDAANDDTYEQCPDDDDTDCDEWRKLLVLQGDAILSNFFNHKISLAEFNKKVKEHNQAVDFYIIECNDSSAEKALKL